MGKKKPVGFLYTENYEAYNFGEGHPLTPKRIELTYKLMKAYGLLDSPNIKILSPRKATRKEVLRVHKKEFLDKLIELSNMENTRYLTFPEFGLGPGDNPIFPNMYDAAMLVCGASITAAEYLLQDDSYTRSHNILGGLHHSMPDMASGFCILNDVAVAIEHIKSRDPDSKIMYVDIDCHHGDGVQWIFYERKDVLTLSFHQTGSNLFPGTGFTKEIGKNEGYGYSLNVPFPSRTPEIIFLPTFNDICSKVMEAYEPDYVVFQTGVDTHFLDPLTQMNLTTISHEKIFKSMIDSVEKYSGNKLLVLGGGGYDLGVVARSWTLFLAALLDEQIDDPLPISWLDAFDKVEWDSVKPTFLRDNYPYIEERLLKDPYFFDELQIEVDKVVDIFHSTLIPSIKK